MFLDVRDPWPPCSPSLPEPAKPMLGKRRERVVMLAVALNLVLVLMAPIAGGSIVHGIMALFANWRH
ncbi:hypothetical protein [Novosphingobium sp.]|uniref:hypothetical protein n=1 Tax=Novosphingobium sp. TaxID=1874826 RepID=UPI003B519594